MENVIEYWPVLYRINTDQCYIELFYVKVDVQIMTVINSTLPNIYCVYIYIYIVMYILEIGSIILPVHIVFTVYVKEIVIVLKIKYWWRITYCFLLSD